MSEIRMDMIEAVNVDVDGGYGEDGKEVRAFLRLEGDFVTTFERYLEDPDAGEITLRITRTDAEELYKQLERILYG